jgi:hypothetical protein
VEHVVALLEERRAGETVERRQEGEALLAEHLP